MKKVIIFILSILILTGCSSKTTEKEITFWTLQMGDFAPYINEINKLLFHDPCFFTLYFIRKVLASIPAEVLTIFPSLTKFRQKFQKILRISLDKYPPAWYTSSG
jgi:hypothetical protein